MAGGALIALYAAPAEKVLADPLPPPVWWKAVAASGPVETRPGAIEEAWTAVRRGDRLEPLNLVRTGQRGRATLTRRGDILMVDPDSRFKDNIEVAGLLLCKAPKELMDQRKAYFAGKNQAQMESVDNNFMRESDARMPLFKEKRSTTSFGNGR